MLSSLEVARVERRGRVDLDVGVRGKVQHVERRG
jgi:hypothetical protein